MALSYGHEKCVQRNTKRIYIKRKRKKRNDTVQRMLSFAVMALDAINANEIVWCCSPDAKTHSSPWLCNSTKKKIYKIQTWDRFTGIDALNGHNKKELKIANALTIRMHILLNVFDVWRPVDSVINSIHEKTHRKNANNSTFKSTTEIESHSFHIDTYHLLPILIHFALLQCDFTHQTANVWQKNAIELGAAKLHSDNGAAAAILLFSKRYCDRRY